MEAEGSTTVHHSPYSLQPIRFYNEDILFCIDIGLESQVKMKLSGPKGRPITRLESIKQAVLLFVHSKLTINPDHRFAFASLDQVASWHQKEFSNEVGSAIAALRGLVYTHSSQGNADLTQMFRIAAHETKKSRAQNRLLRVILIYCRSSSKPQYQWPTNQKIFTLDVIYLHDKPDPEKNCPQDVYDSLVDALEHVSEHEGYIYESGQGLSRVLFRLMCVLLSHPQQRCVQHDVDIPKSLAKKSTSLELIPGEENIPASQ